MQKNTNKQNRIKILVIAGALDMGGLENQLVYIAKNIDHEKYEVDYTSTKPDAYYMKEVIKAGSHYLVVPDPRKDGTIKYAIQMFKVIKKGNYDVVHSQELFHSGIEMFLAWLARVPKRVSHSHSTRDGSSHNAVIKKIYHFIMRRMILLFATDYLACSTAAGQYLYGKNIIKNSGFKVVVNSVDTGKFLESTSKKSAIAKQNGWKYVTHVGRFADVKNHIFMIDMIQEIAMRGLQIGFVFVGDGELFDEILKESERRELTEYVHFLGQRKDVAKVLKESDCFILPSLYEGMPLSLIEAQAAGLPCLVSDHITDEVDFSIGLIHKMSLSEPAGRWVDLLIELTNQKHPDTEQIESVIHKKGFDVLDFQKNICEIYSGGRR